MAVIGSIRRRSGLLIIIIGLAMLAFIIGDIFRNGNSFGDQGVPNAGKIGDTEVSTVELEKRYELWKSVGQYYGGMTDKQARGRAWSDLVYEKTAESDILGNGISFSDEEFNAIRFSDRALDFYKNEDGYKDEAGQFDPAKVEDQWKSWKEQAPNLWTAESYNFRKNRLTKKYAALISKSIIANDLELADSYSSKNVKLNLQYAYKPYSEVADSTLSISDDDIKGYFNAHKTETRYEQIASRDLDFIVFDVPATEADIQKLQEDTDDLRTDLASAPNDSIFSIRASDAKRYSKFSYIKSDMVANQAEAVFNADSGEVVGPFRDGEAFKIIKVVGTSGNREVASFKQILLLSVAENDEISSRADSIRKALSRGGDFTALASKYSKDRSFASNNGVFENINKTQTGMEPELSDLVFSKSAGTIEVIKTAQGYRVVEITDRSAKPERQVVEITKNIRPSSETMNDAFKVASNFAIDHGDLESFAAGAAEAGYEVKEAKNLIPRSTSIGGVPNTREMVRWSYETERELGDISRPREFGDQYIVAALTGTREKGAPAFEDVKDRMKSEVIKTKKAELFEEQLGTLTGLSEAATAWGVTSASAPGVSLQSPNLGSAGSEPSVVGRAYAAASGEVVGPIRGNKGVFVVQIDDKTTVDLETVDLSTERTALESTLRANMEGRIMPAIQKAKKVESNLDRIY